MTNAWGKKRFYTMCVLLIALIIPISAHAVFPTKGNVYLLTISSCPPWKNQQFESMSLKLANPLILNAIYACENTARLMERALQKRYNIANENIISLIDRDATYANLQKAFATLRQKVTQDDRLLVYILTHGVEMPIDGKTYELLLLWSHHYPKNTFAAYLDGTAVTATDLSNALQSLPSKRTLVIIDACHSGVAQKTIKPMPGLIIITSTLPELVANFTHDFSFALFSKILADNILKTNRDIPLATIFQTTQQETHVQSNAICKRLINLFGDDAAQNCKQQPLFHMDPIDVQPMLQGHW